MTPLVSVVIPTYNSADYVGGAIDSVLRQSLSSFEVVVVDDGSTDHTQHVVRRFTDPRVRYLYQENKGLAGARNAGVRATTARYVAFLDADDTFLPRKLELQTRVLEDRPEVGLVGGGWIEVDQTGQRCQEARPWEWRPTLRLTDLLIGNPFQPNCVLVRRSWLDAVGSFDATFRRVEDWDLWLRLARAGCVMAWVEQPVGTYRVHVGSLSFDAALMRAALLQALDKLFVDTCLPADITQAKESAYAWAYANAAARTYAVGDVASAAADMARAIDEQPSLGGSCSSDLAAFLAGWSHHFLVQDAVDYLQTVLAHLPVGARGLRQQLQHALAKEYMGRAFDHYKRGDLAAVRQLIPPAVKCDPVVLKNAGAVSIWIESVIGRRPAQRLRALGRRFDRHRGRIHGRVHR